MAGSDDASKRVVYTRSAPPLEAWLDLEGGGGAVGVLEAAMRKSVADHLAAEVAGAASAVGRRKVREGKGDEDARSPSGTPARASQGRGPAQQARGQRRGGCRCSKGEWWVEGRDGPSGRNGEGQELSQASEWWGLGRGKRDG